MDLDLFLYLTEIHLLLAIVWKKLIQNLRKINIVPPFESIVNCQAYYIRKWKSLILNNRLKYIANSTRIEVIVNYWIRFRDRDIVKEKILKYSLNKRQKDAHPILLFL